MGAQVRKRYDAPQTPYRRLIVLGALDKKTAARLGAEYLALNPGELRRRLADNEKKLMRVRSLKMQTGGAATG